MGRQKQGNANAERNKNVKKGNRTSAELVEFTTGSDDKQKNRRQEQYYEIRKILCYTKEDFSIYFSVSEVYNF